MTIHRTVRFACIAVLATAVCGLVNATAFARRGGGMSTAQRQAIQKYMQQQQQLQQGMASAQAKKDKETMGRFDLNNNGKIDSSEKPAWDKYWREVKLGKEPHPYSTITQQDISQANNSKSTTTKKK